MEEIVVVEGMDRECCGKTVKTSFENMKDVNNAEVDLIKQTVLVETNRIVVPDEFRQALSDTNFKVLYVLNEE
ncbi:MAG: heavy metal-associated domain-containing protein [Alkalibacterium sp.]|nr:heavy metal-associated domain-containing protein [Alkalibacterium sp.]